MSLLKVHCPFGLASRITAIVNGLAECGEIEFNWPINFHCPVSHDIVFPSGLNNVELVEVNKPKWVTKFNNLNADIWQPDRQPLYQSIIEQMAGNQIDSFDKAIVCRFHRNPDITPETLFDVEGEKVFLFVDKNRQLIKEHLESKGIEVILPVTPELTNDLDRTPVDMVSFLSDWKTMLNAKEYIVFGKTSLINPIRLN